MPNRTKTKFLLSFFLAMAFCTTAFAAGNPPLEVVLAGPQTINPGEPMQVTATIVNRSAQPVVIALPGAGGIGYFNYSWKVFDRTGAVPMRKTAFTSPNEPEVTNSNFVILKPGARYQLAPIDPVADLVLAPSGTYSVRLAYRYHQDWSADYLQKHVSRQLVDAIGSTPSMFAVSKPISVTVRGASALVTRTAGQ